MSKKRSFSDEAVVYDTYIFVGEEQPFTFVRVDTTAESAARVRAKVLEMLEAQYSDAEDEDEAQIDAVNYFIDMQLYLSGACAQASADNEEIRRLIPDRDEWTCVHKNKWAPLHVDWPSANTFVLNTWC